MYLWHSIAERPRRLGAVSAALILTGCYLLTSSAHTVAPTAAPLPARTFTLPTTEPAPRPSPDPTVAASAPTPRQLAASHIYLPSLGIGAAWTSEPVVAGALTIPGDVHTVGLSAGGGQPEGHVGTVLLASHINTIEQGPGVFWPLAQVQPGALVILTDAHRNLSRWRVTALADPLKADLDPAVFDPAGPRRLVLITCGGQVHHSEYDRNVVVTATPDPTPP